MAKFKMSQKFWMVILIFLVFIMGCETPPAYVLPEHIKKIVVNNFGNKTVKYGIEEKLTNKVVNEFLRDGRLEVVKPEKADAILSGEVVRYTLEPITYDAQDVVEQYKLWVAVDLVFKDVTTNSILWEEQNMEENTTYFVAAKAGEMVETEETAQERISDVLARNITRRTIEGW